ncbi:MAG TPA: hypothetical protein VH684_27200 [Xanthobacteraceae bacterium]
MSLGAAVPDINQLAGVQSLDPALGALAFFTRASFGGKLALDPAAVGAHCSPPLCPQPDLDQAPDCFGPFWIAFLLAPPRVDRFQQRLRPSHADLRPGARRLWTAAAGFFGTTN